jgi:hypothetical protein
VIGAARETYGRGIPSIRTELVNSDSPFLRSDRIRSSDCESQAVSSVSLSQQKVDMGLPEAFVESEAAVKTLEFRRMGTLEGASARPNPQT